MHLEKFFLKFFPKGDPRRQEFKSRFEFHVTAALQLKGEYPFVEHHYTGLQGVLGFQLFWALMLHPIEGIEESQRSKAQVKTLKRVGKAMKLMSLERDHYALPLEADTPQRLDAMASLYAPQASGSKTR